jgi:hypothetical protein
MKIDFSELVTGDRFRMFEPDGTPVADKKGSTSWIASSNPFACSSCDALLIEIISGTTKE